MGRELVYVLIPPNEDEPISYVKNILDKYLKLNKNISLSIFELKQMFDEIKKNESLTFKELSINHHIEYDEQINNDFPKSWKWYDDVDIHFEYESVGSLLRNKVKISTFIDSTGQYHIENANTILSQSENINCLYAKVWMKI